MEEMNLEEMRNQFAILKEQLDKQEIVNDRLIRETMKAKNKDISYVKKLAYWAGALCLLCYPFFYFTHITSLTFLIATSLLLIADIVYTYLIHKPVDRLNFMTDDFASVAHTMKKFKKQKMQSLYTELIIFLLWSVWAFYELIWKHENSGINPWTLTIAALLGGVIGGIFGFRQERKAMNAAQEIVDEIEKNE